MKQEHDSCQYQFPRFTCTCHLKYTCKSSWSDLSCCDVDKETICQHHAPVNCNIVIVCTDFVHTDVIRKNGPKCIYLAWFYTVIVSSKINRIPTERGGGRGEGSGIDDRESNSSGTGLHGSRAGPRVSARPGLIAQIMSRFGPGTEDSNQISATHVRTWKLLRSFHRREAVTDVAGTHSYGPSGVCYELTRELRWH